MTSMTSLQLFKNIDKTDNNHEYHILFNKSYAFIYLIQQHYSFYDIGLFYFENRQQIDISYNDENGKMFMYFYCNFAFFKKII